MKVHLGGQLIRVQFDANTAAKNVNVVLRNFSGMYPPILAKVVCRRGAKYLISNNKFAIPLFGKRREVDFWLPVYGSADLPRVEESGDMYQVILHRWKDGRRSVIAFFPDERAVSPGRMMAYEHIGQHGEADDGLVKELPKADIFSPEAFDLLSELDGLGYTPYVLLD